MNICSVNSMKDFLTDLEIIYLEIQLINLQLNARFSYCSEGRGLPVRLLRLLPHHHIETGRVLVSKDEAGIVVIGHRIHMECSLEINTTECSVTWSLERGMASIIKIT